MKLGRVNLSELPVVYYLQSAILFFYEIMGLAAKCKGLAVVYFLKFMDFTYFYLVRHITPYYYQHRGIKWIVSSSSQDLKEHLTSPCWVEVLLVGSAELGLTWHYLPTRLWRLVTTDSFYRWHKQQGRAGRRTGLYIYIKYW